MTRLIQIKRGGERRVALVDEPDLRLLRDCTSIYELANQAISEGSKLSELAGRCASAEPLNYQAIYEGNSDWRVLPAVDHPSEPARCLISGTGLTHLGSARERQSMHAGANLLESLTDSMKMFRWGVEGGRPTAGCIGTSPEWFYKGNGSLLRAHGEALEVPCYADDGGEEGEIAGIYLIDPTGQARRIGMTQGNEFSDHIFEKKNYLNLASSKLRTCAIGPELVIDSEFKSVSGQVKILRKKSVVWSKEVRTGEDEMCHSLQNIEHHHFKFEAHRRPGDVHIHFLGADCLSFGEGIRMLNGDIMEVAFEGFGRALRSPLHISECENVLVTATPLG